ncbi:bifunctional cytidylate kinase/GTPase Der [Brachybacterium saurashtrense]|uniref:Multifunctional fusion protein n=1 Tax=Brachybacterium saurashtrense TaxID=556288 RepID=A0A345YMB3_9MICO|nr:bifunctional cytidylate kinase/GTPase Der [Brachybacterium saurashtrense]AXK45065.1 bifunctional cytidylate kinase/GTPase Der [Brachybacterium saurashtrense]RRR21749.1 bifunctional cytidylate kinase/GTPase Der [Brachybacterium saurashtrense]
MHTSAPHETTAPAEGIAIAIDGPAGSGKSTVSRLVAEALDGGFLDTGAMYRAVTWWCLEQGIDLEDREAVARAAEEVELVQGTDPAGATVAVAGTDITAAIRTERISQQVSRVATNTLVRAVLQRRQRQLLHAAAAERGFCVAEGRDITTVVAPDAQVRVLLTASDEERMRRRAAELQLEDTEETRARMADQVLRRDRDDSTVSEFLTAAEGVEALDTTGLDIEDVVERVLMLVAAAESAQEEARHGAAEPATRSTAGEGAAPGGETADGPSDEEIESALRAGLADYALEDEDMALLEGEDEEGPRRAAPRNLPVVAVVGRPNVGKSTLVNRILGRREAVVEDRPGVTRDRVFYEAEWAGKDFWLVDTGGWEDRVQGIAYRVAEQAEVAVSLADVVMFIVDANVGVTTTDEQLLKVLRKANVPIVLVANKVDDQRGELEAAALWNLGLGEPHPVSALHGRGSGDMLDAVLAVMPAEGRGAAADHGPRRVALVGRPNVGKSSLLNRLAREQRVVVDEVAGTTRDPVDEKITLGGKEWTFVDTAGIRRRVLQSQGADYYASLRTRAALDRAEIAVVLLEASEPISTQDLKIIDMVLESGRALVLAFNKWDLLDEERHRALEIEIERDLAHVAWAPRVNISAQTGRHAEKLVPAIETALESWDRRIPTGRLNAFLGQLVAAHPHPLRGGKQARILFATQARTRPPRFVIFASGFLEHGYRRFIERRLREDFAFTGSPIVIGVRIREKRKR